MKNSLTKFRFMSRALAVMLLFSASIPVFGQEQIRSASTYMLCDTSIIREISSKVALVYNRHTKSTFSLVEDSNPNDMVTMYIDSTFLVNDFEIIGNQVYFCGYKIEGDAKRAMFGFFSLYLFPSVYPTYYCFDDCVAMRKIDVYETEYQMQWATHLVMTGTTDGSRSDVLVDININTPYGGGSNCRAYISADESENIDDVAVTEHTVVVSVRKKAYGFSVIDFWRFAQPTTTTQFIFSSNPDRCRITSPVAETPVFLEHTTGDKFVAVCKEAFYARMTLLIPDAVNSLCGVAEIYGDSNQTLYPMDLKYNRQVKVYDILARECGKGAPKYDPIMQIYHVTQAVLTNQVSFGTGTWYPHNYVWSIDPLNKAYDNRFIASGGYGLLPRFFRYIHSQWLLCPEYFEYKFVNGKRQMNCETETLSPIKSYYISRDDMVSRKLPIPFPVICGKE